MFCAKRINAVDMPSVRIYNLIKYYFRVKEDINNIVLLTKQCQCD